MLCVYVLDRIKESGVVLQCSNIEQHMYGLNHLYHKPVLVLNICLALKDLAVYRTVIYALNDLVVYRHVIYAIHVSLAVWC